MPGPIEMVMVVGVIIAFCAIIAAVIKMLRK